LIGDCDQLPPVGAGDVLRDLIESEFVFTTKLSSIFRQAEESLIIVNAHRINSGEYPYVNEKEKDFFFMERSDEQSIVALISELATTRLSAYYDGIDPIKDIQVLTPVRKGALGTASLNAELQKMLNPPDPLKTEKKLGDRLFREGDKVMQTRNNYQIGWKKRRDFSEGQGVFNGEVGYILHISHEEQVITVEFDDGKLVEYSLPELEELDLAYALTVHKSQGSEFPIVIIPSAWVHPLLATRNLLYTAVTRGKMAVIIVGARKYIDAMVANDKTAERNTALAQRLVKYGKVESWREEL